MKRLAVKGTAKALQLRVEYDHPDMSHMQRGIRGIYKGACTIE